MKKGENPPCDGCKNAPPTCSPGNLLADYMLDRTFVYREDNGRLPVDLLFKLLEMEGVSRKTILDCFMRITWVEPMIRKAFSTAIEKNIKSKTDKK